MGNLHSGDSALNLIPCGAVSYVLITRRRNWPMMSLEFILAALLAIIILNILAILLFRHDKKRAREGGWRVPESTLLLVALLAPFGAAYGMRRYHHKTRKLKFLLVYVFILLQLALGAYLLYSLL
jgi:uncharacterized membrane protein YsdA (DUF1294 family)